MKWSPKYFLLLSLVSAPIRTDSSTKHTHRGTVIYSKWFKDEIIVAADSRTKGDNGYRNDECKITTYKNEAIFALSGLDILMRTSLYIGARTPWPEKHSSFPLLGPERKTKHSSQQHFGEIEPSIFSNLLWITIQLLLFACIQKGQICDAVFAVRNGGTLSFVSVEFYMNTRGEKPVIEERINPPYAEGSDVAMGYSSIIVQFFAQPMISSRAKTAYIDWQKSLRPAVTPTQYWELLCIQLIKWTIDFKETDEIGGDVNAAVLDSTGIHWLKQENYCKAANQ